MTSTPDIDFTFVMEMVARRLLGEPNAAMSNPRELRFGSRGSLSVDVDGGRWFDHERGVGGGVLDLVRRETGRANGAAIDWLRDEGLVASGKTDRSAPSKPVGPAQGRGRIVATYPYHDEGGELLFEVVRFDPKDFRQRQPDGNGGWIWSLKGVEPVLYRLPVLVAAADGAPVFIVEGERDCDRLAAQGLLATCNPGGAGKWRADYAGSLRGKLPVLLPDNDAPGWSHATQVKASLRRAGIAAAILKLPGLPEKGDVSDWLDAGGTPGRLIELAERALAAPREDAGDGPKETQGDAAEGGDDDPSAPLFAPASWLAGEPVPSRRWLVEDLIPDQTVTMLGGDGGTGKSLLALQLAVAVATDRPWIGRQIDRPGCAMFLSAEDDAGELHRRLAAICAAEGLGLATLDRLMMRSLAGENTLLAVLDRKSGTLAETALYAELDAAMAEAGPALIVLDTLADLHSGEENSRAHARQFVGMLRRLAIRHGCAVLLLAHPSLTGMATGSGLSGSTAWNASVRARLYLGRVTDSGYEGDPDARRLSAKKANYAPAGGEIALRWREGVFVPDGQAGGLDRMAASAKAERVFHEAPAADHGAGPVCEPEPGAELRAFGFRRES